MYFGAHLLMICFIFQPKKEKYKMKNNINVDFGDGVTSIFYWHESDTLRKLKECIYRRYNVPLNHQIVKYKDVLVDEELFTGLHQSRFNENVTFKVEIPDPTIIKHRRTWIAKQNRVGKFEIPWISFLSYDHGEPIEFKVEDPERKVSDLIRDRCIKSMLPVERRLFLLNNQVILTNEHVLADLFLDFDDVLITMLENRENKEDQENLTRHVLHSKFVLFVDLVIPRINCEDSIIEYPLIDMGHMHISVMKSWIGALFHIPIEGYELHCQGEHIVENYFVPTVVENCETFVPRKTIRLHVYSTANDELRSIYEENNIRTMVPIHVTSFEIEHHWVYHYRGQNRPNNVFEFIEDTLKIPQDKQHFFYGDSLVNPHELFEMNLRTSDIIEINLAAQVDDGEIELLEIIQRLRISRLRSIIIKHPSDDSVMFDFPLSKVKNVTRENYGPLYALYEMIRNESQDLSNSCL